MKMHLRNERSFLDYVKAAFLLPWNTMVFGGAMLGAAFSPDPAAFMALVVAAEGLYLAGLTAHPRFRTAIDAQGRTDSAPAETVSTDDSWRQMLATLPPESLARFERLRKRCREMRHLARAVQRADESTADVVGSLRTTGLDQLLWGFLRLLQHHSALQRLLGELSRTELAERVRSVQSDLARATEAKDDRLMRSYQERLTTTQTRLDYYDRTARDADFLRVELDRVEEKILALSEMAVNQHDPNVLSAEIDAAASSMQATETSLSTLGIGMTPAIPGTTPAILDAVDPAIEDGPRAAAARAAARARMKNTGR
jgi:hypothetical protein